MMSRAMRLAFRLPPAVTHDISVDRDIGITMPDGVVLLADRYYPSGESKPPTILVRSTYTDRKKAGWQFALFAEQGFGVLVVSGRGVCGSGGELTPFVMEREDGAAVVDWLKRQAWFNGELCSLGASYLGYTQWAIAAHAGDALKAFSTQFTCSDFRRMVYPGGGFYLELWMWWLSMVANQERSVPRVLFNTLTGSRRNRRIARHLPLGDVDRLVTGKEYPFWRRWLELEEPDDPFWVRGDLARTIPDISAPDHLIGGWYDFMTPGLIGDYAAMKRQGLEPYLTVGPWSHFDSKGSALATREGVIWLRAHLFGERERLRASPVRIYVMGAGEWRDYSAWPPEGMETREWYLHPGGRLTEDPPRDSGPDAFTYDPGDPTPSVGGAGRAFGQGRCVVDNRELESRDDVLTYTSEPLGSDLEVIGPVSATIFAGATTFGQDVFVRLCDVDARERSMNVCDGLARVKGARGGDAALEVEVELWPTAYRFRRGHRVRVQVSGGSFPRWNRNPGRGEPVLRASVTAVTRQCVYHDPARASRITLPVIPPA